MKNLIVLLFVLTIISCKTTQENSSKTPFVVKTASYQNWYGGREGSRGIKIEIKGEKVLNNCTYKTIYFFKKEAELNTIVIDNTIELKANINTGFRRHKKVLSSDRNKEFNNKAPIKSKYPNIGEEEAVIEYLYKGKLKTLKLILNKKKDLFYQ